MYEARIIADSICAGHRLTTMQLTHPRIVHAEFNTHCAFARNASSSRAIPFAKMVQRVVEDPFVPKRFGVNQAGMQAFRYLEGKKHDYAVRMWLDARDEAISIAKQMASPDCVHCHGKGHAGAGEVGTTCLPCDGTGEGLNIHKQIVNRLLEPWMWMTVCVTGDWGAWSNYFSLRCHPDAEDNIQEQAYGAQLAYFRSKPKEVEVGQWHLPYILPDDGLLSPLPSTLVKDIDWVKISVGRCARTSYLTQEGKRDWQEDVRLHDRLADHAPLHASPFEHVCQARGNDVRYGKYTGWEAYRHMLPNEYATNFEPNHPELISA